MQLPSQLQFGKRLVTQVMDDEVPDLAAGLAYRFLFAVFPFGIFLAALAAFVAQWTGLGDPTNEILSALGDNLPPDVAKQIAPQLQTVLGEARPGLVSVGAVGALWAATGGISALITAMNKAYDVGETRNFFAKMAVAVGLTLLASAGILVAFVTLVGGSVLTEQAIRTIGIDPGVWEVISLARFPVVLALVALAVAVLFHFGPNVRVSFRWTLTGGIVFAIGWVVATVVFALYVANFGSYANTYGALGGVVVLMLWFYITALLLLVSAELTSLLAKEHEPERVQARRDETAVDKAAKKAAHGTGKAAGAVAGAVQTATSKAKGRDDGRPTRARDDDRDADRAPGRRAGRDADRAPGPRADDRPPLTRIPRPEPAVHYSFEPRGRLAAVAVLIGGALAGAIAGLLASDDEDDASHA